MHHVRIYAACILWYCTVRVELARTVTPRTAWMPCRGTCCKRCFRRRVERVRPAPPPHFCASAVTQQWPWQPHTDSTRVAPTGDQPRQRFAPIVHHRHWHHVPSGHSRCTQLRIWVHDVCTRPLRAVRSQRDRHSGHRPTQRTLHRRRLWVSLTSGRSTPRCPRSLDPTLSPPSLPPPSDPSQRARANSRRTLIAPPLNLELNGAPPACVTHTLTLLSRMPQLPTPRTTCRRRIQDK